MLILSNFVAQKTLAWTSIHSWVTNSTTEELLYRLLFFASDLFNLNYIKENDPTRAYEIARSKAVLSTLVGHNVRLIPDTPINAEYFLHMQSTLMDNWHATAAAFQSLNAGLKEHKYRPKTSDPNFMPGPNPMTAITTATDTLTFNGYELQNAFMPMPVLAVLCPVLRYDLPRFHFLEN